MILQKIASARRLVVEQLALAESPAVLWSSGEDSQLLLWFLLGNEMPVSVVHFRSLPSSTKHEFADAVIDAWELQLSDMPRVGVDVVANGDEVNLVEEYAVSPEFSLYLPMENEPGRPVDEQSACGVQVLREKQAGIRPAITRLHDVLFIGHHAGDGDLVLGELEPDRFIAQAADVRLVYPLADWTKEDVRAASRILGVWQNDARYAGAMSVNPDYFPLCTECLKPNRLEDELLCPKLNTPVLNLGKVLSPETRREAWRRRFINIKERHAAD